MMRFSLVLVAGAIVAAPAPAATWADALFDEVSKDFGSVPRGPTLVHPFRISNNGKHTVHISGVRVSCGCVSASATKNSLAPGEEAAIVARMDTTRFTGQKSVTVFITFDRPRYQEVRLMVQAYGRNDFNITPDTLSFGRVKRGSTPSTALTLTFHGNSDLRVQSVKVESNYILPKVTLVRRQSSEVVYNVTAAMRSDAPVGKWYSDLWLKTNSSSMPQIRIPLTVDIESALSVTPDIVSMGRLKAGNEAERKVIVRGIKPFKITAVEGTDPELAVHDSTTQSKTVHVVTVKLKPGTAGDVSRKVRLVTDLTEDGTIEFQVNSHVSE